MHRVHDKVKGSVLYVKYFLWAGQYQTSFFVIKYSLELALTKMLAKLQPFKISVCRGESFWQPCMQVCMLNGLKRHRFLFCLIKLLISPGKIK